MEETTMGYGHPGLVEVAKNAIDRCNQLEQLRWEEMRLETRLAQVRRGQKILQAHPDLLELLEILGARSF